MMKYPSSSFLGLVMNYKMLIAALLVLCLPEIAYAALGEHSNTISDDQRKMHAVTPKVYAPKGSFTVHEFVNPAGTTIREFVNASGAIFAVAWDGPSLPDLQSLLGTYFEQYTQEAKAHWHQSHRHAAVHSSQLVVESAGHLGAFHGMAYIPRLLPAGVTPEELQ
jgi:hypothetical protein